jgi:formylmethanofuran dehydrogenase subunit C
MPQENLNKIWNAGKYFEPKPEQPTKEPTPDETKPSNIKRKISVVKAFIPKQEDPFKKKVEAVLKGVEPAPAPATADAEVIVGKRQNDIGKDLVTGSIRVLGDAGYSIGYSMSGGEIYAEGNVGIQAGYSMSGGKIHIKGNADEYTGHRMFGGVLRIDGDVASFDETAFTSDNKGTIIWKGETIWKDGQKEEPGWTNLKVEEKIAK